MSSALLTWRKPDSSTNNFIEWSYRETWPSSGRRWRSRECSRKTLWLRAPRVIPCTSAPVACRFGRPVTTSGSQSREIPRQRRGKAFIRWTTLSLLKIPPQDTWPTITSLPMRSRKKKQSMRRITLLRRFSICRVSPMPGTDVPSKFCRARSRSLEADALEFALDEKWEGTEAWIAALRVALNRKPRTIQTKSSAFRRFADRILHFDGVARKESVAALDYLYWRVAVGSDPAGPEKIFQAIENHKELSSAQQDALLDALDRALRDLTTERGSAEVALGDVYRIGRGGSSWPIGGVKFEAGGPETTTMRAMQAGTPDSAGLRWVTAGQRQPCLTIFSNPVRSFTSAPYGQSDHAQSPHYSDQARLASERRLKPTYFNREDLMKHIESKQVLSVE
jgi:hypothetical protein